MDTFSSYVYVIKELEVLLRPRFIEACAGGDVTGTQYTALTVLERHPGITSSELARRSFVRAQSMAETMEPLISAGLVRRERDETHARRKLLFLTPAGADTIAQVMPEVKRLEDELVGDLSPAERQQFADYLRRCWHALAVPVEAPVG